MTFIITGKKMEVTDALKQRIEKKLGKLERYFRKDTTANVFLSVERGRHTMEVTVNHGGIIFRSQETSGDMYTSLDKVISSIERQIEKNKTRLEKRLREGAFEEIVSTSFGEQEEKEFNIIKRKKFALKPMDLDEAILQMNLLAHEFFVFKSLPNETVSVVYKRKDGGYGLIEPE